MNIQYSDQAKILIEHLKEFDKEDFEYWFRNEYMATVGGGHILDYLKERQEQNGMGRH